MQKGMLIRDRLKHLNKIMGTMVTRELADVGITMPQISVLRKIKEGPLTIGQLSKELYLSYSTVSGIVDRLEREEYIERVRDKEDRRVIWIKITDKFEQLSNSISVMQKEYFTELIKDLSDGEVDNIVRSLQLLITQLEKRIEERT
ncbi:MarR family winged helix-turn-helix transcriptional regulator [Brevibacillus daliensis]|uniref:MarR family winged helix-turn-helix transcriptional regulator n=1 Tax=Brevibacillus daliensis TaxID=2892995 RepID=UPI001E3930A4|nr:MarR family transcriptional regulator [Brevibacillus daliensis]